MGDLLIYTPLFFFSMSTLASYMVICFKITFNYNLLAYSCYKTRVWNLANPNSIC